MIHRADLHSKLLKQLIVEYNGDFIAFHSIFSEWMRTVISIEEKLGGNILLRDLLWSFSKMERQLKAFERLDTIAPREEVIEQFVRHNPTDAQINLVNFMFDNLENCNYGNHS